MFDKYRARFAKFEEDHESVRKAKKHVEKHQTTYAAIGGGAITLVAVKIFGGPQVIVREAQNVPTVINNTVAPVISPVMHNSSSVNFGGHLTKMVERVEDGQIWKKVKLLAEEIAEEQGVPFERAQWLLSRHLNGKLPNVYGVEYAPIGVGTTG